jgi:hypothetical protein
VANRLGHAFCVSIARIVLTCVYDIIHSVNEAEDR